MRILTINAGSSSLKATLYDGDAREQPVLGLMTERIGQSNGHMRIVNDGGHLIMDQPETTVCRSPSASRSLRRHR